MIPWHNCFIISEEQHTRLSNHLFPLKYTASSTHLAHHTQARTHTHACNFPEHTLSGGSNVPFDDGLMNEKHFEVPLHETMMFDKLFPPWLWVPTNTAQRHKTIKITIPSLTDDAVYKLHFILSQTKQCNPTRTQWIISAALWYGCHGEQRKAAIFTAHPPGGGHTACPQESHLISSSLHVINLPPQCYCSNGHSSSFREKGIDQASLRNAFVRAVNRKRRAKLSSVYEKSPPCCVLAHVWAFMCERVRVCPFVCVCVYKQQDQECVFFLNAARVDIDVFDQHSWPYTHHDGSRGT